MSKLNGHVKAWLALKDRAPRRHGVHPSEFENMCPALFTFVEEARRDLLSANPQIVEGAYNFLRKTVNEGGVSGFVPSPGLILEMEIGSALHELVQFNLGAVGMLHGSWECPHCEKVESNCFMPRVTAVNRDGISHKTPAPCLDCDGKNLKAQRPWRYIEPAVVSEEFGIKGHTDGIIFLPREFDPPKKAVLEVKSINSAGFDQKFGKLPKPEHITQASIYAHILGIDTIYFVYVKKDQVNNWKEFEVSVDQFAIQALKNKVGMIKAGREALSCGTKLPLEGARVCQSNFDRRARLCPAAEKCFGIRAVDLADKH